MNRTDSVLIHVEGTEEEFDNFSASLVNRMPVLARIDSLCIEDVPCENLTDLIILESENNSDETGDISPDIAVCDECLNDMSFQSNRIGYPFINCTNCGPRFSIIRDYPYDRKNTTMDIFRMCNSCEGEYHNIEDRRFHAQPVACEICGPSLELYYQDMIITGTEKILDTTADMISEGKIIALKGMGGFQLICDAGNETAVELLRKRKKRDGKPFAVMMRDMDAIHEHAHVSEAEEKYLRSHAKPVVILRSRKTPSEGISRGLSTIGCLLPYMPLHYLLFRRLSTNVIIFTSGNISGEPIVIDNSIALNVFPELADAILVYDRDIYNRSDDSVIQVIDAVPRMLRRSRGYVPGPVSTILDCSSILACGPEQKVTFTLGSGRKAIVSQHIGDLENIETFDFYTETIERYKKIFRIKPELAACDLHPDYMSTRYAETTGLPLIRVQHHHAHICACMAEYGIDREVLGVALDGTGFGDDGAVWGSEFMLCSLGEYKRLTHLEYFPLPGGDRAIKEPWRTAVSLLYYNAGIHPANTSINSLKKLDTTRVEHCIIAIDNKINSPMTSSMGRLIDCVAVLLGLCDNITFEAEGPIRLEGIADRTVNSSYGYDAGELIGIRTLIAEILSDIESGVHRSIIAGKFHNTLVNMIARTAEKLSRESGVRTVVLSGGIFQNRIILGGVMNQLNDYNLEVLVPSIFPVNDGGISLGQLVSAAKRRSQGCV